MEDDKFPRFAYDLVDFLDENVGIPSFPKSANAFAAMDDAAVRQAAFTAGARSVVDMLIDWRAEMEEEADAKVNETSVGDVAGPIFPRILGDSDTLHRTIPSTSVGIGGFDELLDDGDQSE
jgi:hypothetical protein